MTDPTITCPNCKTEIKLTESLAAPLLESTRQQYEQRMAEKEAEIARREAEIRQQQQAIARAKEAVDQEVAEKLKAERAAIAAEEAKKARLRLAADLEAKTKDLAELQEVLKQREEKLAEAQKAQAELLRKQRELDDKLREADLTVEQRVQQALAATREKAKREAEEELKLKLAEREYTIAAMQKQIEDLKRRAEQGSQQLQGEVQELELEALLRQSFPQDKIEPVPKGEHGGDVLQRVWDALPQCCGTILWESKRTKNWSDGWLAKLRDDQRAAGADVAVIVSQALPKEVDTFAHVDGVWITSPRTAIPVAFLLRHALVELGMVRQASQGQRTKMELIYEYLTGPRFRHRLEVIVEKFHEMREDLDRERKTLTKLWAKRNEQINRVIDATCGMYGDLQGITGQPLLEIEGLESELLGDQSPARLPG
jgi:hypothetical protein